MISIQDGRPCKDIRWPADPVLVPFGGAANGGFRAAHNFYWSGFSRPFVNFQRWRSSDGEQRFCKPKRGDSSPPASTRPGVVASYGTAHITGLEPAALRVRVPPAP